MIFRRRKGLKKKKIERRRLGVRGKIWLCFFFFARDRWLSFFLAILRKAPLAFASFTLALSLCLRRSATSLDALDDLPPRASEKSDERPRAERSKRNGLSFEEEEQGSCFSSPSSSSSPPNPAPLSIFSLTERGGSGAGRVRLGDDGVGHRAWL